MFVVEDLNNGITNTKEKDDLTEYQIIIKYPHTAIVQKVVLRQCINMIM